MVQLYRFTRFLTSLLVVIVLSPISGFSQAQVSLLCNLDNYHASNGHAIHLSNLPGSPSPFFVFDSQGGTLTAFNDGTARLTGTVQHVSQTNLQWEVDIWLINKRDLAAWTALGRGIKKELAPTAVVNANSPNWDFYELDDTRSRLIGTPGTFYGGDTLFLSHRPSNFDFGFQVGVGANAKNGNDGMSGWFFYSGAYTGIGDVNVNRSCTVPICDIEITQIDATCLTDTTFEVSVAFTGTGNQFEITDNQGSSPISGVSAGTYTFSSYPNNTNVQIVVTDMSLVSCADTSAMVTQDCTPPAVCDVTIDSLASFCLNDTSFEVLVYVSGTGAYTLTDDFGLAAQTGANGIYTFGPYPNNTTVSFSASDNVIASCGANAGPITKDCAPPPPVCDLAIDSISTICLTDSSFEVRVVVAATANTFELNDDQGSATQGTAGTFVYTFGPYPNNTSVNITATSPDIANCSATAGPVSTDCGPPPPVCDLAIDSISTICLTDSSFEVRVVLAPTTNNFQVSDDQGSPVQGTSGTFVYTFGPYANNTSVNITATNPDIANCSATAGPVSTDCGPPPPVCDLDINRLNAVCLTDSSFQIQVFLAATTNNFQVSDDQGSATQGAAGTFLYTFGPYSNNTQVSFTATNPDIANCSDTAGPVMADCEPDTCAISLDGLVAECASDTSFRVVVTFSGIGDNFSISDNVGSPPMTGLSPGTYDFGDYFNSTDIFITVSDSSFTGCTATLGPVTADCTPVPVCDIALDTSFTNCITDSTFEVVVSFTGTGNFFQIFDNLGTSGITNLSAGTYSFGTYPNGTPVQVTILDFAIFNCFVVTPVMTDSCDTSGGNGVNDGISNFTSKLAGKDLLLSWESSLRESGTYYLIEKKDGFGQFETIGERQISEMDLFENKYFFTDFSIKANKEFLYRIRQVKPGGQVSFSEVIKTMRLDQNELMVGEVYPNPSQGFAKIKLNSGSPHRVAVELLDGKGALISASVINTVAGAQELEIPAQGLRPGLYLVRLRIENKETFIRKIIITE